VGSIAERCGLGTEVNLRHHFTRLVGVAPTQYRRTFKNRPDPTGAQSISK
jgi:transcriptional regulator GlxA family with amidase domain